MATMCISRRLGVKVGPPKVLALENDRNDSFINGIKKGLTNEIQMRLVVTIVPQQKSDRYAAIKKFCYLESPIASQVIVARTLENERRLSVSIALFQINTYIEIMSCFCF